MTMKLIPAPLSIAPMLDVTDRHFRYMMRQITKRTLLYSEMVTTHAILRGSRDKLLAFDPVENPIVLQLGGDDPEQLAQCSAIAEEWGYDEVNLNVGCPSDKVQSGSFGACLMAKPAHVAECVRAMKSATTLPVSVKHRIGIDGLESYDDLRNFVETVANAGCDRFVVHARIAVLSGLSPKQNRTVPPLRYGEIFRLKEEFPHLTIEINGGIATLQQAKGMLGRVDGAMMGRAAAENPYQFIAADEMFFNEKNPRKSRREIILAMIPYFQQQANSGNNLRYVSRHVLELMKGLPNARKWRRLVTEGLAQNSNDLSVFERSLNIVPAEFLDSTEESPASTVATAAPAA